MLLSAGKTFYYRLLPFSTGKTLPYRPPLFNVCKAFAPSGKRVPFIAL